MSILAPKFELKRDYIYVVTQKTCTLTFVKKTNNSMYYHELNKRGLGVV